MFVGCSSDIDSNWKKVNLTEPEQEIEVDWNKINSAIDNQQLYQAQSIKEAEMVTGYHIVTFEKLPEGFKDKPEIYVVSLVDKVLSVTQKWSFEKGTESNGVILELRPKSSLIDSDSNYGKTFNIEDTEVKKIIGRNGGISLKWEDG